MAEEQLEYEFADELVVDDAASEDSDVSSPLRYRITSYGADYPVDALVRRLENDDIKIPDFQRKYVWTQPQASRLIESLLLGLPIPAIFLSQDPTTQQLLVIDGQQRLTTLRNFYEGLYRDRKFKLMLDDKSEYNGLTYSDLEPEDRRVLDNSLIHSIIVSQREPKDGMTGLYSLFERINTAGTPLQPQEIRSCIMPGKFDELLQQLAKYASWASIYGKPSRRGKDQELILRFFALYFERESYSRPMKQFLNDFMEANRDCDKYPVSKLENLFKGVADFIKDHMGPSAVRPKGNLNAALTDALFVGVASRLEKGDVKDTGEFLDNWNDLLDDGEFEDVYRKSTADEASLKKRLDTAIATFADIE